MPFDLLDAVLVHLGFGAFDSDNAVAYYSSSDKAIKTSFSKVYTRDKITFNDAINVYHGTTKLVANRDYTVTYANNTVVAGVNDKKAPTVNITGKGNYNSKVVFNFTINKADLDNAVLFDDGIE